MQTQNYKLTQKKFFKKIFWLSLKHLNIIGILLIFLVV